MNILLWHQGALGDLMLSMPSIIAVRKTFPDVSIRLISRTDATDLLLASKIVDSVTSNDASVFCALFSDMHIYDDHIAGLLDGYSRAFVFMRREDMRFMLNLRRYVEDCRIIRTVPGDQDGPLHVSEFQLSQIEHIGIFVHDLPSLLQPSPDDFNPVSKGAIVTIHPGSGGRNKCWPIKRFAGLIENLAVRHDFPCCILLGPAEVERSMSDELTSAIGSIRNFEIVNGLSLSAVASLLSRTKIYIGNDSGITHMAAMLGTPTVAIFGPTDDRIWGPRGENVRIVRSAAACSPCSPERLASCRNPGCLSQVGVDDVLTAARSLL